MKREQRSGLGNLRGSLALWIAKMVQGLMKRLGRNATTLPGRMALAIDPRFLYWIDLPRHRLGVTGTNGKTTSTNMLATLFEKSGFSVACNRKGSNMATGICSALLEATHWRNQTRADVLVIEVDEVSAYQYLPALHLEELLVTNLFRDQYDRIGHVQQLVRKINQALDDDTRLFLNAHDVHAPGLGTETNPRQWFAAQGPLLQAVNSPVFLDLCPQCGHPVELQARAYADIGPYACTHCDWKSPTPDATAYAPTLPSETFQYHEANTPSEDGVSFAYPVRQSFDLYNLAGLLAVAKHYDLPHEAVQAGLAEFRSFKSRFEEEVIGEYHITNLLSKGKTPIPLETNLRYALRQGPCVVVATDQDFDQEPDGFHNMGWLYDVAFELCQSPQIVAFIACGARYRDYEIALRLRHVPEEKIFGFPTIEGVQALVPTLPCKNILLIHSLEPQTIQNAERLMEHLRSIS